MKNMIVKFYSIRIAAVLLLFSFGIVSTGHAQAIKWLRVSELQSFINEIGAEYESESTIGNTNFFSWPAQYGLVGGLGDQNTIRQKGLWIGSRNFNDPVENKVKGYKVIGSGPRDFSDRINQIFPQEIKLVGKAAHPIVIVDNQSATALNQYDILDEIDPSLEADRAVIVKFNTSIGISVTKKVMVFANSEHGNYFINDYVFKNTGIVNRTGKVQQQTLQDTWFYFVYRFAFAGVTSSAFGSTWGAFESQWGNSTLNHDFGDYRPLPAPNSDIRGFYSYYGPSNSANRLSYAEEWGAPNRDENGILGGKPDQHYEPDLREDVVVRAIEVHADHRGEKTHRHDQDHGERQRDALIQRREEDEHEHDAGAVAAPPVSPVHQRPPEQRVAAQLVLGLLPDGATLSVQPRARVQRGAELVAGLLPA